MTIFDQLFTPLVEAQRFYGIAVAKVSSNVDEDGLGRVKVTYPCPKYPAMSMKMGWGASK